MNRTVAYSVLSAELAAYRQLGYEQLLPLVGNHSATLQHAADGAEYAVHVAVLQHGDAEEIVVHGSIAPSQWGSPHDRLDESIIVNKKVDSSDD